MLAQNPPSPSHCAVIVFIVVCTIQSCDSPAKSWPRCAKWYCLQLWQIKKLLFCLYIYFINLTVTGIFWCAQTHWALQHFPEFSKWEKKLKCNITNIVTTNNWHVHKSNMSLSTLVGGWRCTHISSHFVRLRVRWKKMKKLWCFKKNLIINIILQCVCGMCAGVSTHTCVSGWVDGCIVSVSCLF